MIEITFPAPGPPWSANKVPMSVGAKIRRDRTRAAWRNIAKLAARGLVPDTPRVGPQPPSCVRVSLPFTTNRRRDPHNYTSGPVKSVVDGLVDAGVWPDDNPEWVTVLDPELVVDRTRTVTVTLTPREGQC